jgi:hypothetical protein
MKSFSLRAVSTYWIALLTLILAACGSDNNPVTPITPGLSQVTAINSTVPDNIFSATLNGGEVIPAVTSNASAAAAIIVDLNTRQIKATVITADVTATGVNAHEGIKGINGAEVIPFTETSPGRGVWTAASILSAEQLEKLKTGTYYINIKSAAFPDGEIRGQVRAQLPKSGIAISTVINSMVGSTASSTTNGTTGTTPATTIAGTGTTVTATATDNLPLFFTNLLSGSLVIPANTSSASAIAISLYKPADKSLTSALLSTGMTGTAANIREAAADATGPVVASLTQTVANSGIWTARNTLSDIQIAALNAGNMYYEILSAAFPSGEVRGQIVKTEGASKVSAAASTTTSTTTGTTATITPAIAASTAEAVTPASTAGTTSTAPTTAATATTTTPVTTATGMQTQ